MTIQKTGKLKKIIIFFSICIVSYLCYTAINIYSSANKGYKESVTTAKVDPNFKKFSILMVGIDENESRKAEGQTRENSRTDSLIYLAVDKDSNRLDMVSIPRDSLTLMRDKKDSKDPNSYFFDKITHAYAYGGIDQTIDSVSSLLNAPVNFYVIINFEVFKEVIDSLGGVRVYVPFDMIEQNSNGEQGTIELKEGWHNLKGEEALAFARSRYYDSDIERGQRQLQIIHAVIDKAKRIDALSKINDLIKIGGDNITHNMSLSQIASAASIFVGNNVDIHSHRIGGYDAEYGGVYYYYPKPQHLLYVSSILNNSLGNKIPSATELTNIYYQGRIQPLEKQYSKVSSFSSNILELPEIPYVLLSEEDMLLNLPKRLNKIDLQDSPTLSNENKPLEKNINNQDSEKTYS